MTYAEKLKDPRWQKKRLEVLSRDEFTCRYCGSKEITLHVHHLYYVKGGNPWETEADGLVTLCEDCHYVEGLKLPEIIRDIFSVIQISGDPINPDVGNISPFFRRWLIEIVLKHYPKNNGERPSDALVLG